MIIQNNDNKVLKNPNDNNKNPSNYDNENEKTEK